MKVKDLIQQLQGRNPEDDVVICINQEVYQYPFEVFYVDDFYKEDGKAETEEEDLVEGITCVFGDYCNAEQLNKLTNEEW